MGNIIIIEKPDYISFETIKDILHEAHSVNFQRGIVMHTTELNAEELQAYLGDEGKCFVALDGNKVVGTASLRIRERNTWYIHGRFVDEVLVGVLPEYSGKHIYSMLYHEIESFAKSNGFSMIIFNTASGNKRKQKASIKNGFQYVSYFVAADNDHYSVVMAKWLESCPYSKLSIWCRYQRKKFQVILRYKPGKINRF